MQRDNISVWSADRQANFSLQPIKIIYADRTTGLAVFPAGLNIKGGTYEFKQHAFL